MSKYNGYKVYGADGCQITTVDASSILGEIEKTDIFNDVKTMDFDVAIEEQKVKYIEASVLDNYIEAVKNQSVLFSDEIDKNVSIVYTPLNGTGLVPVTRVLKECGYTSITVVEEQKDPDGTFPTCPYPNPEVREAMELGLEYASRCNADLLLATDPDADRCGIAVKNASGEYQLLSANETGILMLDFICSQRQKHNLMPENPVFMKTIVTMDLAEKIAESYGVRTFNTLTGFKFIGEQIGRLEEEGREEDFIFGFEESYGYLSGSYVRDKDAVNAALIIAEMYSFYATRGISLLNKLEELYKKYGYCMNTLHSYEFPGSSGMEKMEEIMSSFHAGLDISAGMKVTKTGDYSKGLNGLPKSDVLKFYFEGGEAEEGRTSGSVVIRPSGTEPKLKMYISVTAENQSEAENIESRITTELENQIGN